MSQNSLSSFLSEHSVEYALVPNLVRQLTATFQDVIPIFFWSTREGNTTAGCSFRDVPVKILSIFARRPKISASRPESIFMKINSQLLEYATRAQKAGIPTLAGIPLAASLEAFGLHSSCCWFQLNGTSGDIGDQFVEISLDGTTFAVSNTSNGRLHDPLSGTQIQAIASNSRVFSWENAVDIIRSLRTDEESTVRYFNFGGYKPFHLILSSERTDI
jgi:hypothetical protein